MLTPSLDGRVPDVLGEALREFDVIYSNSSRGGLQCKPPPHTHRQPNQHFDVCTPIIAVTQMSGLCRAQLCPTLSFEGLSYCFLLLWALQSPACHHCLIYTYPHLVILCCFLRARQVSDHAITML